MKILFIIHSTAPDGSTISFLNLIRGLRSKGIEISVAGPTPRNTFLEMTSGLQVSYHTVRIAESVYPQLEKKSLFGIVSRFLRTINLVRRKVCSYFDIKRVVSIESPDIIHTNVGTVHEGYEVARRLRIPHVWHIREYQDKDFGWLPFPSKTSFIRKIHNSYVITITHSLESYFGPFAKEKARTVYNGVLRSLDEETVWPKKKFFLCASRISPEKGIDDAIRAFSAFYHKNNDYSLVVLGDGDPNYVNSLKRLAKTLECADAIIWAGYKDNVVDYMRQAACLIVASHNEGFGRMTAEACFAGCIVVGRNTGGTKEIIEAAGGELFDSVEELTDKLRIVSGLSEDDYQKRSSYSIRRANELYSIESNVDGVLQFYKTVLAR